MASGTYWNWSLTGAMIVLEAASVGGRAGFLRKLIINIRLVKDSLHRFANFTMVGGCAVVFW